MEAGVNEHSLCTGNVQDPTCRVRILIDVEEVFVDNGWEEGLVALGKVLVDVLEGQIAAEEDGFDGFTVVLVTKLVQSALAFATFQNLKQTLEGKAGAGSAKRYRIGKAAWRGCRIHAKRHLPFRQLATSKESRLVRGVHEDEDREPCRLVQR